MGRRVMSCHSSFDYPKTTCANVPTKETERRYSPFLW